MLECWKVFKIIETLTTATDKAATKKTQLIKKQQRQSFAYVQELGASNRCLPRNLHQGLQCKTLLK